MNPNNEADVNQGSNASVLAGVPKSLPALLKALRIQEKASAVGFDWQQREEVWEKVGATRLA